VAGIGVAGMRVYLQIKRSLRRVVPDSLVNAVRSANVAIRLGLVFPWLATLRNTGRKSRFGTQYGGWTIPNDRLTAQSICYCVGCGEDISFDLELIRQYSCNVYAFDPTPRSVEFVRNAAAGIAGYRFADVGIWDRDGTVKFFVPRDSRHVSHSITNLQDTDAYIEVPTRRLRDLLRENGHRHLTLLKLDIEGAESTVIRTILEDAIPIDILLVEFDELGFPTPERMAQIKTSIHALLRHGYKLFNIAHTNFTFVLARGAAERGEPGSVSSAVA
jgi:FkbM family methyltransferase